MRQRAYPEYKDSGVQWLGQVPAHWEVDRCKWSILSVINGVWGSEPDEENDLVCERVADFDRTALRVVDEPPTIRAVEANQRDNRLLRKGDLLIEKSGGGEKQLVGCVVHYDLDLVAVCSNFVARMPIAPGMNSRFWTYVHAGMYAGRINYPSIKQTTGIQNLNSASYLDERVAYPPLPEQTAIADFLDRETGLIETLVAKKRRLIELLKEKRSALISRTVTRGLPADAAREFGLEPHTRFKDSGIEWLGQVPKHWEVKRLKFAFPKLYSGVSVNSESSPADQESVGVMKTSCVYGNQFIPTENKRVVDEEIERLACPVTADSIVVSRMNTPELVGNCGYVDRDYPNLFLPDRLWIARFSTRQELNGKYAWYLCISDGFGKLTGALATGTSGSMKNLSQEAFLNIDAIIPPLPEQTAIATYLDRETAKLDRLVEKVEAAIARLQEYRTALITAAVTGKIDVREAA